MSSPNGEAAPARSKANSLTGSRPAFTTWARLRRRPAGAGVGCSGVMRLLPGVRVASSLARTHLALTDDDHQTRRPPAGARRRPVGRPDPAAPRPGRTGPVRPFGVGRTG